MLTRLFILFITFNLTITQLAKVHGEKCNFDKNNTETANRIFKAVINLIGYIKGFIERNVLVNTSIYNYYKKTISSEDKNLYLTQLLNKYGYPVETHELITSDGYLLKMFRIPNRGPPVFIMHGVLSSSDDFFTIGSNSGLGYLLANAGYDVWLGNARGNKHSRRHATLSPSCAEFWDFSWDEIGRYDLPAMIDYILNETNERDLVYIGHSQGITSFFVLCSEIPEYNNKIKVMIALSAVAFKTYIKSFFKLISPLYPLLTLLMKATGLYEFLPRNTITQFFTDKYCGNSVLATLVCGNILYLVVGYNLPEINATALPVVFGHYPAGVATKQLLHYAQIIDSEEFKLYDYGSANLMKYGSLTPPDYPLQNINSSIVIYYSHNDVVAPYKGILELASRLGRKPTLIEVPSKEFTHSDFLFGKNVKALLYDSILNTVYRYTYISN